LQGLDLIIAAGIGRTTDELQTMTDQLCPVSGGESCPLLRASLSAIE